MSSERKPVAFGDMRGWLKALEAAGEVRHVDGEVDWNIELGTIARLLHPIGRRHRGVRLPLSGGIRRRQEGDHR